jgi:hypothetical protein
MGLLSGHAGRLTDKNGGFRPAGQAKAARELQLMWELHKALVLLGVKVRGACAPTCIGSGGLVRVLQGA